MGLLRLATYAILGYAAYTVISDLMQSQGAGGGRASGQRGQGQGQRRRFESGPGAVMSGPAGEQGGRVEQTEGADGGSTPTRVGRGVIST